LTGAANIRDTSASFGDFHVSENAVDRLGTSFPAGAAAEPLPPEPS
jgi:hypothetical protein